jgi:hypothetical protein
VPGLVFLLLKCVGIVSKYGVFHILVALLWWILGHTHSLFSEICMRHLTDSIYRSIARDLLAPIQDFTVISDWLTRFRGPIVSL